MWPLSCTEVIAEMVKERRGEERKGEEKRRGLGEDS